MDDSTSYILSPVDSAFVGGSKALSASVQASEPTSVECCSICLVDILSVVSVLLCVLFLKRLY